MGKYSRFDGKEMEEIECLLCMMATGTYVFDKSETNRYSLWDFDHGYMYQTYGDVYDVIRANRYSFVDFDKISSYQTYGDLESIRDSRNNEFATGGYYVFAGHNV